MLFLKPLRSTGVTPLHRYYGLLRHPFEFRFFSGVALPPPNGLPRFLTDLSARAVPFHPGCSVIAFARCFITDIRFHHSRQVNRQRIPLEAVILRVRFRYGSRVCFPRLQHTDFAAPCLGRYMSNRQFTW